MPSFPPPASGLWLLRRVLPADQAAEIESDLAEVYASRYPRGGYPGQWWFWRQTSGFTIRYLPERLAERLGLTRKRYWRPSRPNRNRKASAMEQFTQDLRLAMRGLLRERGFSAMVIFTLALGIGATTAVFSVVNEVLLKPLPFPDAERVMMVWENDRASGTVREFASVPDYYDFLELNTAFEDIAMFNSAQLNLTSSGMEPQRLNAGQISHGWDDLLGIRMVMGRGITPEEDQPGGRLVAMISEGLWTRQFAASPDILGTTITLNDQAYTIIGVVGKEVSLISVPATDLWVPLQFGPTSSARSRHNVGQIARLKPGVSVAQAQEEMTALATELEEMYAENTARGVFVEPITEVMRGPLRPTLLLLFGAVVAVLLIACANVANLLLARGSRRATEVAVHAALGATPRRMLQRFLAESLVLTSASWVIGIGLAFVGLRAMIDLAPASMGSFGEVTPDILVLGFTLVASGAIAFGFGLLPAWQGRRLDLQANLKEGRRQGGAASVERMRFRHLLVVVQMAMAFVLLIGSALLINSFWRLNRVDPGFTISNVLRVSLRLPESRYPRDFGVYPRWPEVHQFNERLLQTVSTIPGIRDAALAVNHPLSRGFTNSFRVAGRVPEPSQPEMSTRLVSADYFRTMGVPLAAGRGFEDRDHAESPRVMLINQAAADRFFPDGDAIGSRITFWGMEREVVGIVGNERFYGVAEDTPPAMYASTSQAPPVGGEVLLVRTAGDPRLVVNAVREAIWEQDADLAIFNIATLDETLAESLATERFTTVLLLVFGGVALILALVGVYGVLAYIVTRRRHEIGVRLAIGASGEEIIRMVLRQGMVLALAGMVVGIAGAVALSGSLRSLLYDISPLDPATYVLAAVGLVIAAGLACLIPALRASRVDPVEAMRAE